MRKLFAFLCAAVLCFALVGCGDTDSSENETIDLKEIYNDAIRITDERISSEFELEEVREYDYPKCICGNDGSYIQIELKYEALDPSSLASDSYSDTLFSSWMDYYEYKEKIHESIYHVDVSQYQYLVDAINELLGLPESFSNKIGRTSGADGEQTQEFDDIIVTWSYYENDHFYIIYEMK